MKLERVELIFSDSMSLYTDLDMDKLEQIQLPVNVKIEYTDSMTNDIYTFNKKLIGIKTRNE